MNSEICTLPLLTKGLVSHLIILVLLSSFALYCIIKSQTQISYFIIFVVFGPFLVYFFHSFYALHHTYFEIAFDGLRIQSGLHKRTIDLHEIRDIFIPDSRFKPKLRICGLALPGCKRGWFTLGTSRRALLFATNFESDVCVRTSDYVILMSVENPERFVRTSHAFWHGKGRSGTRDLTSHFDDFSCLGNWGRFRNVSADWGKRMRFPLRDDSSIP